MLTAIVSDNGSGISPDLIESIFDKDFSTKGEQRSVGLFLVKQEIENCHGNIQVKSVPGILTQFIIQLLWSCARNNA